MYKLFDYQQKLVNQVRKEIASGHRGVLIVSPPGSGKSVVIAEIARLTIGKGGHVMFFVHRRELIDQITKSFKQQDVDLHHCTIMTVRKIANRLGKLPKPNLIICDESHHSKAKTYQKIFDYYSNVPRLGFTGSPWRMNGQGFADIYSAMIQGPTVKWLIEHHKLAPFCYYSVPLFDQDKLKKSSTGDYTVASMTEASQPTLYGDIIKTWLDKAKGKRTIVYAHDTKHSQQIAQAFRNVGVKAQHCDSKTPSEQRKTIMNDFRTGKITVLCNYGLVDEGYDVKECECCVIARPTGSLVFNIQSTMRCMRYLPNKVGIIIDHAGNYKRFGLPDTQREWTLEGREKGKTSSSGATIKSVTVCQTCFASFYRTGGTCPYCGAALGEEKKIEVVDDAELKKVTRSRLAIVKQLEQSAATQNIAGKRPNELKSFKEIQAYAKLKGYRPGWAYYYAKQRGFIK